ncbi:hypothetical protein NBRC10512_005648 [Rhodotorula toruloides]|uniref:RHTO0S15e00650g1_1 n=2 Tax=Rhodotorula toruloides TaxID=5286 RepID=A0A061BII1_RHOTO|nr:uncharacterized protein RHTO_03277 [Rhodotorula toruloides NP11]EMS25548.1 hypothetical protein RHTO_03277 [Rhodotorula toruloides NP11]CDR47693.1 RHTO0S15e00650g1_1 [Rhodotorula toruloides]
MHRFFDPALAPLHARVLDFLTTDFNHASLLVTLQLNRHFRQLSIDRIVRIFSQKPVKSDPPSVSKPYTPEVGGGFIRIRQCDHPDPDFGPSLPINDPRELFRIKPRMEVSPSLNLFMTSFDPKTHICTFEGAFDYDCLEYALFVEPSTGREWGCPDGVPCVFQAASNYWFRPALDGKHSQAGLQVAASTDLYPARTPAIWPKAPQERGGKLEQPGFRCWNGWTADIITHRLDEPGKVGPIERYSDWPKCLLIFEKLYVPLIDLLVPPMTAADDLPVDFGEELDEAELDAYIDEDYDNLSWIRPSEERRLAREFVAVGGIV